jgi:hypothetical protein
MYTQKSNGDVCSSTYRPLYRHRKKQRRRPQSPGQVGVTGARHSGQVAASPLLTHASMHTAWNACEQPHSSATTWHTPPASSPAKQMAQTAAPSSSSSTAPLSTAGGERRMYRGAVVRGREEPTLDELLGHNGAPRTLSAAAASRSTPAQESPPGNRTSPWHGATPRRSRSTPAKKRSRSMRSSRRFRRSGSS